MLVKHNGTHPTKRNIILVIYSNDCKVHLTRTVAMAIYVLGGLLT
jgi:hypothetical protein